MIVAGIGCRRDVGVNEVVGAISASLAQHGIDPVRLGALATSVVKGKQAELVQAARRLSLPLIAIGTAELAAVDARCFTDSSASRKRTGLGSLAEAAALAGAGGESQLVGPRMVYGNVTCALALSREETLKEDQ